MNEDESIKGILEKVRSAHQAGELNIDTNGHITGFDLENIIFDLSLILYIPSNRSKFEEIFNKPIQTPFNEDSWFFAHHSSHECRHCGKRLYVFTNGRRFALMEGDAKVEEFHDQICIYSKGLPTPIEEIEIKSDQMVLGNDLRDYFTDDLVFGEAVWRSEFSINHYAGKLNYIKRYASHGMLTGYLGNTIVGVYHSPTSIIIGDAAEDEKGYNGRTLLLDGITHNLVASICCDLWWYGAADWRRIQEINEEKSKNIKPPKKFKEYPSSYGLKNLFRVPVKSGKWRMTHYGKTDDYDETKDSIYSRLQLIGD